MVVLVGRECTVCEKPYVRPCDGQRPDCPNLLWVQAQEARPVKKKVAPKRAPAKRSKK